MEDAIHQKRWAGSKREREREERGVGGGRGGGEKEEIIMNIMNI